MGRHHDEDGDRRADQVHGCSGENRADPDSWDDPAITDTPWAAPMAVAPAELDENGEVPLCS